jgi:hypothetical protein
MSQRVPLAEQIAAVDLALRFVEGQGHGSRFVALHAVIETLKWVERHQAELRVLGEFPIENIEVLTPQATGLSAIGQGADEGEK